ncbi:uncharacterized protein V1518DRAFT_299513 [Limtongia smithiae]|uniref:uncharacterized protein n=1 Tax=Limtongia smithiae TaxID=1125753 RepID=UPI0034CEFCD6
MEELQIHVSIPGGFVETQRERLRAFADTQFHLQTDEDEFKQWTSQRSSIALRNGGATVTNLSFDGAAMPTLDRANPADVEFELKDFKELFSKLKVTYLEQETKETFLRLILDDDGDADMGADSRKQKMWEIDLNEISKVTTRNEELKQILSSKKKHLQEVSDEITAHVNDLCKKYEVVKTEVSESEQLLEEIESMRAEFMALQQQESEVQDVDQKLSMREIAEVLATLEVQETDLDHDISKLRDSIIPDQYRRLQSIEANLKDLTSLQTKLEASAKLANEVRQAELRERRIVEQESMALWYSNALEKLSSLLGVDSIDINSAKEHLIVSCRNDKEEPYTVKLIFTKGRFYDAKMITPVSLNIQDATERAVRTNDVRSFMQELIALVNREASGR